MENKPQKPNFTFSLNDVESEKLRQFIEIHKQHARHTAFGELVKVSFVPSTMGTHAEVQCLTCGETIDLTDLSEWDI